MANVKLVVIYPHPKNVDAFENIYQSEHVPLAVAKLGGKTKMVATKILGSPQGVPPFYRVAEVTFRRCRLWKRAPLRKAGRKFWQTP